MNLHFVNQLVKSALNLPLCPCQKDSMETIHQDIKNPEINYKRIQDLIRTSQPDLKVICEDGKVIHSHKLLFGLVNSNLAKILLEDDFIGEHVTVFLPASSAALVKVIEEGGDFSELERIFSNSIAINEDNPQRYEILKPTNSISITKVEKEESTYYDWQESKDDEEEGEVRPVTIKIQKKEPLEENYLMDDENSEECSKFQKEVPDLAVHRIACEQVSKGPNQCNDKVICPICNNEITFTYFVSYHYYKCSDWTVPGSDIIREKYAKKKKQLEEPIPCSECGRTFVTALGLTNHLRFHRKKKDQKEKEIFQCDKCEFNTVSRYTLKDHMIHRHTAFTYVTCEVCGRKLKPSALKQHMRLVHTEHEMINCDECGKQLRKDQHKKHIQMVHSERKHSCHLCSYKAQTTYNLKLHIHKSHLGNKQIPKEKCQYCEAVTTNMSMHMKEHHPEI